MARVILLLLITSVAYNASAVDYTGNNVLTVLGVGVNTPQFKEFKNYWVLNKDYVSSHSGLKLYVNNATDRVESILIAGENLNVNNERFDKYTAQLPFGLSFNDDPTALSKKLGTGEKLAGSNTLKFLQKSLAVEVSYNDLKAGKISAIKIYKSAGNLSHDASHSAPANASSYGKANNISHSGTSETRTAVTASSFKRSIMEIFKASRESGFASIEDAERAEPNFWNYKYTYKTKISVPGGLYSMLYKFPFVYSESDFVVVIKEANHYDESFETAYHSFEKQLLENFKPSEGWVSACISGSNKAKLPDLEVRNDKLGAIILDCSQNPRGKQVLYLRFLFFSN